jgi:hypothetical protein
MAARNYAGLQALGRKHIVIAGSFATNNTDAVSAASRFGPGWSVARSATGKFTITFRDKFDHLVSAVATAQLAADNVDLVAQVGVYTASAKTLVIKLKAAATNTDLAADADNRVNFVCVFANSATAPKRG